MVGGQQLVPSWFAACLITPVVVLKSFLFILVYSYVVLVYRFLKYMLCCYICCSVTCHIVCISTVFFSLPVHLLCNTHPGCTKHGCRCAVASELTPFPISFSPSSITHSPTSTGQHVLDANPRLKLNPLDETAQMPAVLPPH